MYNPVYKKTLGTKIYQILLKDVNSIQFLQAHPVCVPLKCNAFHPQTYTGVPEEGRGCTDRDECASNPWICSPGQTDDGGGINMLCNDWEIEYRAYQCTDMIIVSGIQWLGPPNKF